MSVSVSDNDTAPSTGDRWVNLSYSPCPSATSLGFGSRQMNKVAQQCSRFWLAKSHRLLFGHDWRPDGVMRSIGDLAEKSAPFEFRDRQLSFPRLLNLVPHPSTQALDRSGINAERTSEGVLAVRRLCDVGWGKRSDQAADESSIDAELAVLSEQMPWLHPLREGAWNQSSFVRLWALRAFMTRMLSPGIRICFGGKTEGYSGCMPGIFEEALFAFCDNKPLYLIGGFGGATADFATALMPRNARPLYGASKTSCYSYPLEPRGRSGSMSAAERHLIATLATEFHLPRGNIADYVAERGLTALCRANGLDEEQNQLLFRCTDIETALDLIYTGVRQLEKSTDTKRQFHR